jgi:hypothetical protein
VIKNLTDELAQVMLQLGTASIDDAHTRFTRPVTSESARVHDLLGRRPHPAAAKQIKNRLYFDLRPTDATRDAAIVSSANRTLTSLLETTVLRRLHHFLDQRL